MKRLLIFLMVLMLTLPAFALADRDQVELRQMPQITVNGSASVRLAPDYATLSLGVETKDKAAGEAIRQNAAAMDALIAALKAAGVAEGDLATASFSLNPYDENSYYGSGGKIGYMVSNTLTVTVRDLDAVGSLIDTAVAAGANQVYGLSFQSDHSAEAEQQALKAAIANATSRAALMAEAAGSKLGKLLTMNENGSSYPATYAYDLEAKAAAATPIVAGELDVGASVTMTFALE